jgi:cyclic beta-1,2-glucan synthetase
MQRAGVESILGVRMQGEFLRLDPCIPKDWPRFEMTVRYRSARYEITVENPDRVARGVLSAMLDGASVTQRPLRLFLRDDGATHHIQVTLGVLTVPSTRKESGVRQSTGSL